MGNVTILSNHKESGLSANHTPQSLLQEILIEMENGEVKADKIVVILRDSDDCDTYVYSNQLCLEDKVGLMSMASHISLNSA